VCKVPGHFYESTPHIHDDDGPATIARAIPHDREMTFWILRSIRDVYLALHQGTDSAPTHFSTSTDYWDFILADPTSYPVCKVPGHFYESTPHIHDDDGPATIARAIPHDPNNTAFVPSLTCPDPSSSSTHAPLPVNESLIDALGLNNLISVQSFTQPIGPTTTEACRMSTISPSPITACTMHKSIDPSSRTIQPSTSSLPPDSNAAASPPDDVAVWHTALSRTPSDGLNVLSSPSHLCSCSTTFPYRISFVYSGNCCSGRRRRKVRTEHGKGRLLFCFGDSQRHYGHPRSSTPAAFPASY
jgi:hypothetical protein